MENQLIQAVYADERVIAKKDDLVLELYEKSRYGEPMQKTQFQYSLVEALYLLERGKILILKGKKELDFDGFLKLARKMDKNFWIRYVAFKEMRNRGYIVKTALKFGADFRVYDRGVKPGEDHAKWVMYPIAETAVCSWYEFAAKNRVAHSTRKRLLIAIIDEESDCTFYEIKWTRP
jgi:tRNA-intron endonuclease, archaea type